MAQNGSKRSAGRGAGGASAGVPAVAVVVSRYNDSVTSKLLDGAREAYGAAGGPDDELVVVDAPGAYELVALSNAAARSGRFAGVVALGCVIKGETDHDRYINSAVAHGLAEVTVATGVPVAFGVLTVNTARQARERAGGVHGNKGAEAMNALLATIRAAAALSGGGSKARGRAAPLPDKARGNGKMGQGAGHRSGAGRRG